MIRWCEEYSVGVESLDTDHKLLICMINQLETVVSTRESAQFIGSVLDALTDYTVYHFAREEAMMRAAGYPDFDAHARAHDTLAAQVREIRARFRRNPDSIHIRELLSFLNNWLVTHIVGRDSKYAPHLADAGYAVDAAELYSHRDAVVATAAQLVAGGAP